MTPDEYQQAALRTEFTPECININTAKAMTSTAGAGNRFDSTVDEIAEAVEKDHQLAKLLHAALGMCTETGEAQDMIKKHLIYGKPLDLANFVEECGDALWYIALGLHAAGVTMEDCMQRNISKLMLRYPDKFTAENALNRDLAAERVAIEGSSDVADENPMRRESRKER